LRLERLFKDHHQSVWRTLRRRGLTPEVAADVTQQAFLIAAERLDDIAPGSERAFVMATALRLAISSSRRERRLELADDMDVHPSRGRDPTDARTTVDLLDSILARVAADEVRKTAVCSQRKGRGWNQACRWPDD